MGQLCSTLFKFSSINFGKSPCIFEHLSLTASNKFLQDLIDRSFSLFNLKFFVKSCIFATSIPIDLQLFGDRFFLALPSRKETIIKFLPLKLEIDLFELFVIGIGHLKPELFNDVIRLEKKGRSFDFTLFSYIVNIYFFLFIDKK